MTQILTILLYSIMGTFVIFALVLIYDGLAILYWIYENKFNKSNTEYEDKRIKSYKKKVIKVIPVMIVLALGILFYYIPLGFQGIVGEKEPLTSAKNVHVFISSEESISNKQIGNKTDIEQVLRSLNKYKYRRSLLQTRIFSVGLFGEAKFVVLVINIGQGNKYATLEITDKGYIRNADGGQVYKIISKNNSELLNALFKELSEAKQ